jgi:hypothetical protein
VKEDTLTVASKARQLEPGDFPRWLHERELTVSAILDTVKEQVAEEKIEPIVGARIASCVAGSVFGYEEFHPRGDTPPAEQFLEALSPHTERGLAGSRP